jgi:plastocyanin
MDGGTLRPPKLPLPYPRRGVYPIGRLGILIVALVVAGCAAPATSVPPSSAAETDSPEPIATPTAIPTLEASTEEAAEAPPGAIAVIVGPGPDFVPADITAPAGTVAFFLDARQADVLHNMVIAINAGDVALAKSANLDAGMAAVFTVHGLEPGTYEVWCSFPGHFEAGMKGTLTIT